MLCIFGVAGMKFSSCRCQLLSKVMPSHDVKVLSPKACFFLPQMWLHIYWNSTHNWVSQKIVTESTASVYWLKNHLHSQVAVNLCAGKVGSIQVSISVQFLLAFKSIKL